ncbi:MAG: DUF167 domain-containing protein [Dehalococcoidales bacterium]|nr:DUF167 domain-containing protein [Dehalococcoidales bacterium]
MKQELPTKIVVQVQPKAKQNQVLRYADGVWHLKIAAPPVEGKANQGLVNFLSEVLGISKASLTIEKGLTAKRKVIAVKGMTQDQVISQLKKVVPKKEGR